jgi:hypothetical protein
MQQIQVLLISGWGRSGSTILSSLLGQLEGFLSVGELRNIWDRGLLNNTSCACSESFRDCALWSRAARYLIDEPREEIERVLQLRESFRSKDCFRRIYARLGSKKDDQLLEYSEHLRKIYESLQATTGCRVIVDSSKAPTHGYILSLMPEIDLYVIHIVRDPRAVAFSWKRMKVYSQSGPDGPRYMRRRGAANSSLHWLLRNFMAEHMWSHRGPRRYYRLRYEDFVERPRDHLKEIQNFLGDNSPLDFFIDSRTVRMKPTHELSGNPSRFSSGTVEIAPDTQWMIEMPRKDRLAASAVALPMLFRYGYSGLGGRAESRRAADRESFPPGGSSRSHPVEEVEQ